MKRLLPVALLSVMAASEAYADWDPELEARERAKYEAMQRESARKDAEAQRIKREAEAKVHAAHIAEKRKYVGADANGKSDAEVERLYEKKVAATRDEATRQAAEVNRKMADPQNQANFKAATGHSIEDVKNMSDEELEAFSKQLEDKYGQ